MYYIYRFYALTHMNDTIKIGRAHV
jgi:hypothetical protein